MIELLYCPFCGNDAALADMKQPLELFYFVVCTKCQGKVGPYKTKKIAMEKWNKRYIPENHYLVMIAPEVIKEWNEPLED